METACRLSFSTWKWSSNAWAPSLRGTSFDRLAVGDFVEISGFLDEHLRVRATRLVMKPGPQADGGKVKSSGYVVNPTHTGFMLGETPVDYNNADLSGSAEWRN